MFENTQTDSNAHACCYYLHWLVGKAMINLMALWQIPTLENAESLFSYRHCGQDSTIICPEFSWYCGCTQHTIKSSTHFCAAFEYLHVCIQKQTTCEAHTVFWLSISKTVGLLEATLSAKTCPLVWIHVLLYTRQTELSSLWYMYTEWVVQRHCGGINCQQMTG